jgi:ubiquitin C-terminal hydrolase
MIQCLNSNLNFSKFFLSGKFKSKINKEKIDRHLVDHWNTLSRGLWKQNCVLSPTAFLFVSQKIAGRRGQALRSMVNSGGYGDSQEFLQFLLETFHNGLSQEVDMTITGKPQNKMDKMAIDAYTKWREFFQNDYSYIIEKFYGQYCSVITTPNDPKFISETYDPVSNITLEIPKNKPNINIYDCFDLFSQNEKLDKDSFRQKEGDTNTYHKKISLWKLPQFLVIFFKRYDNKNRKIDTLIDFPIDNLDLSKYCIGYDKDNSIYELHAIANHDAVRYGGHHYAYTKNEDGLWYKFDDTRVTLKNSNNLVTEQMYCLFYTKKNKARDYEFDDSDEDE